MGVVVCRLVLARAGLLGGSGESSNEPWRVS
jgi:hypothetical protein